MANSFTVGDTSTAAMPTHVHCWMNNARFRELVNGAKIRAMLTRCLRKLERRVLANALDRKKGE